MKLVFKNKLTATVNKIVAGTWKCDGLGDIISTIYKIEEARKGGVGDDILYDCYDKAENQLLLLGAEIVKERQNGVQE